MIKIISGSFTSGAHEYISDKIKALIAKEEKNVYLIVPEQQTLSMEKEMSKILPPSAPLFFEVSNFTRLANSVFRILGGVAGEHSDRTRRALVMWEALAKHAKQDELKILKVKSGVNSGLVNKAIAALNEADSFGIDSKTLSDTANQVRKKNERLANKLDDLAIVSKTYKELLMEKYGDTGDELSALADKLSKNSDCLSGAKIFIEGFTSFTEPQYEILKVLKDRADVTVSLTIPKSYPSAFEYKEPVFTKSRLENIGAKNEVSLDGAFGVKSPYLYEISKFLFRKEQTITLTPDSSFRLIEAETPYEEAKFVAEDIKRQVIAGEKYSDFLIIARHADTYVGTLDDALSKSQVPYFFAKPSGITSFEATKHLISAISTVSSHFAREELINYMKSGFSGASRGACDEFELFSETWHLTGRHFLSDGEWNMNPDGYEDRFTEEGKEKLKRINETKASVLKPLKKMKKEFEAAVTVENYATALYNFIKETNLEEKIKERAKKLLDMGETELSEENALLYETIIECLEILVKSSKETEISADGFKEMLLLVFNEAVINRIPSYKDQVTVGSADSIRRGAKHVYIIGAVSGEFPYVPKDSDFFSDKEKLELKNHKISAETNSEYNYSRELFYFARAFASATDSVTLIYSVMDFSFKPAKPSEPVKRVLNLLGKECLTKISDIPLDERVFSERTALTLASESENLRNVLLSLGYGEELKRAESSVKNDSLMLSKETAELIYKGSFYLSQSQIDKFINCPLAHFCSSKLSLSENKTAEFNARIVGNFVHSIFEKFFIEAEQFKENGLKINEIEAGVREKIAFDAAEEYISNLTGNSVRTGRENHMIKRLKSAAIPVIDELCDEFSNCDFEVKFNELKISDNTPGLPSPVEFELDGGGKAKVYGRIDRVDVFKSGDKVYLRVADYKTGYKKFAVEELAEGKNVQIFLYLKALIDSRDPEFLKKIGAENGEKILPAGAIYVKNEFGDVRIKHQNENDALKEFKNKQDRCGMVLEDEESLSAMNKDFLPVTVSKSKNATGGILKDISDATRKYLYTEEGFDELIETIRKAVNKITAEMKEGSIPAKPMKTKKKSACEYCGFKPICRNVK